MRTDFNFMHGIWAQNAYPSMQVPWSQEILGSGQVHKPSWGILTVFLFRNRMPISRKGLLGGKLPSILLHDSQLLILEVGVCGASLVLQAKFLLLARQEAVSKDGLKEDQLI